MDPIKDENGQPVSLDILLSVAATELSDIRRREASNLIKNFLIKAEDLTRTVKQKEQELAKAEESLKQTLEKIKRIKAGDWSVLKENQGKTKVDSAKQPENVEM